ncbi:hypothetical protein ACV4QK_02310 [Alteromonas macleodii]
MFKLLWSFILIVSLSFVPAQGGETTVDLNENTVIYHGKLSPSANQKLLSILKSGKSKVEWLSITSEGGEINHGMDLGDIVHDYDLKLEVNEYCLSSCANYVFSAANHHRISNHAVIGFHGGTTGMEKEITSFIDALPEEERELTKQNLEKYMKSAVIRERNFFEKIGVDQRITTLGQSSEYKEFAEKEDFIGWYYSLEGLATLGVFNIDVVNPPWSYQHLSEKTKFFKVRVGGI